MKRALWLLAGLLVGGAGPISAPYNLGVTDGTTSVQTPNKLVVSGGTITNSAPGQATLTVTGGVASNAAGTIGQLQFNLDGTGFGAFTLGGDATVNTGTGVLTIGHIGGKAITLGGALTTSSTLATTGAFSTAGAFSTGGALTFANLTTTGDLLFVSSSGNVGQEATTAITTLGTITQGTWQATPIANVFLANSTMTIAGHSIALGGTQALACGDLSNGATGCSTATGTSGATLGLLNGSNTYSGSDTFSGALTFTGLTTGSQVSCLGLTAGNVVVLSAAGCGTGGGGGSLTVTDGTTTVGGTTNLSITGATVGGTTPNATLTITGASGVTFTDGVNSVTGATTLLFSQGTISGTTPNATLTLGSASESDTGTSGATVPLLNAANTASNKWTWSASTTARASMNIPAGTAPTSCINGDVWSTAAGLFGCYGGVAVGPYAPASAGGTTITIGPGLTNTNGTQNTGAQTIINGSTLAPQMWPVAEAANHTATLADGAGVYLANGGSAITFTLPASTSSTAADGSTGVSYCFGDETGHGYTIATTSAQVLFGYPTATGTATTLAVPANSTACATSFGTVSGWYVQMGGTILTGSTIDTLSPAAAMSGTDGFPCVQGSSTAVECTAALLSTYVLNQLTTYEQPMLQFSVIGAAITLDYSAHNGRVLQCDVSSCTITLPSSISNLGTTFSAYVQVDAGETLHLANGSGPVWIGNAGQAPITVVGPNFVRITTNLSNAYANVSGPATNLTTGTTVTLVAPRQYQVCTTTCTITVPVPLPGYEFCVMNDDGVSTPITLAALGSSARYENTARTAYGTATTGTLISSGSIGDQVCIVGRDSTHYLTTTFKGTWVAN